jgi:hypothetical protein
MELTDEVNNLNEYFEIERIQLKQESQMKDQDKGKVKKQFQKKEDEIY